MRAARAKRPAGEESLRRAISVREAERLVLLTAPAAPVQRVPLAEAAGRILREAIRADRDMPPFDRVTMDGFALRSAEWRKGSRTYEVEGLQPAGAPALRLRRPRGCVETMTGAPLPRGCDCVIPVEYTRREGDTVHFEDGADVTPGACIHPKGSDERRGAVLLESGARLRGPEIGILASVGCNEVDVARPARIIIITTGDELVPVAQRPRPHQIRGSNAWALAASLRQRGFHDVTSLHAEDNAEAQQAMLCDALDRADVLVLTGGVSKGRFDLVPATLAACGVRGVFHGVRQQPGKPLWFGVAPKGQPVFGLPGNPVSALVSLHRYILPALERAIGLATRLRHIRVDARVVGRDAVTRFQAVRLHETAGGTVARMVSVRNSGDFAALRASDGFVEVPPRRGDHPRPERLPYRAWE